MRSTKYLLVDVTHLHLRVCPGYIRNGGKTSANIDTAFEKGIAYIMTHRAYVEKRRVEWDEVNKKII